jgi:hypothetical protein
MQGSIGPTKRAFDAVWPEAERHNILDDALSLDVQYTGLDAAMDRRFAELAQYARGCNASGILFTCSAFGSCIEKVKSQNPDIPVLKPNEAMMEEAVKIGGRIGVLSVFEPTVSSIVHEMHATALALGRDVDVEIVARQFDCARDARDCTRTRQRRRCRNRCPLHTWRLSGPTVWG